MDLLNIFNGETGDILQNIAFLSGDQELLKRLAGARLASKALNYLTGEQQIEALRNQTILNISKYVKENPNASKEAMIKEIGKQIYEFQKAVEEL